ncbi:hypothetical protein LOAG_18272 [Loa loa]|uniref:Reverse transcriptase domain-containing protein n=1 Tax=Loa loa TaxID=7209 RepID=A0A1I7W4V8_LOALO|nr:hypothetical protein LOAG_18272 [Loa loa]EJD74412.1 hypothetical protein LOAG_18272 [Loa loa]
MSTPVVDLSGKVALITGATSGIGYSTAHLFHQLGATLVITGRNTERLKTLEEQLQNGKGQVLAIAADLTKEEEIRGLAKTAINNFHTLDILVNNAGIIDKGTIENTTLEQYDRIMSTNLRSMFYLTQQLIPQLIASKGSIVNVSSVNGMRSFPGVLAYNISKAGVDQFTRCIALELASKGVRVNSVNPGVTRTDLHRRSGMDETAYEAFIKHSTSTHALGRVGNPDEVANAIAFLASSASSFITGTSIPVDGGRHVMCPLKLGTVAQRTTIENEIEGEFIVSNSYDDPEENEYVVASRSEPVIYPARRQREDSLRRSSRRLITTKRGNDERTDPLPATFTRRIIPPRRYSPGPPDCRTLNVSSVEKKPCFAPHIERGSVPKNVTKEIISHETITQHIIEQNNNIAEMTDGPVFRAKFINTIADVPLAILMRNGPLGMSACDRPPIVRLTGHSASFSFIVDLTTFDITDLIYDGLDGWSSRGLVSKFFFNKDKAKCVQGKHEYTILRKVLIHPHTVPSNSVRKVIWQVMKGNEFCRYALISYNITNDAVLDSRAFVLDHDKIDEAESTGDESSSVQRANGISVHTTNQSATTTDELICEGEEESDDIEFYFAGGTESLKRQMEEIPELDAEGLCMITDAPVFVQKFVGTLADAPLELLIQEDELDASIPVCTYVPKINLYGAAACLSFLIDTKCFPVSDISADNLGQWNAKDGRRMSVRKFYYRAKSKPGGVEQEYCVVRRRYLHPHCIPNNSIRKVIWLIKKGDEYCRYSLVSYYIEADAHVMQIPHGNSRTNQKSYIRTCPSEVKKRPCNIKQEGAILTDTANTPENVVLQEPDFEVGNEVDVEADDVSENSEVDVDGNSPQEVCSPVIQDALISDSEMVHRISLVTTSIPFNCTYINAITELPLTLLRRPEITHDIAPVNTAVPQIRLISQGVQMSFIVDTSQIPYVEWNWDGLGAWNTSRGNRVTLSKYCYDTNDSRCGTKGYAYCVIKKKYVHPYSVPPSAVRKVVWLIKEADGTYNRYMLVTYKIERDAVVTIKRIQQQVASEQRIQRTSILADETIYDQNEINLEIARVTKSPVFLKQFINNVNDLPLDTLLEPDQIDLPVCDTVPHIAVLREPTVYPLQMTFLIDTEKVAISDLSVDNLGQWNTTHGRRMTLRKFYFSRDRQRCLEGGHYFTVVRKTYVHPNSIPDGMVRKIIWQACTAEGYARYAIISYDIGVNTVVEAIPHGNSKRNTAVYQRKEPSLIAERKREKMKRLSERSSLEPEDTFVAMKHARLGSYVSAASGVTLYEDGNYEEVEDAYPLTHEELMNRMALPSLRRFTRPYHNDEPFSVVFLLDQRVGIVQCASCGVDFSRQPQPPEDLVLEHVERFWNQRTCAYSTQQMQKKYIHARLECVLARYEYFTTLDFLVISDDVRMRLTNVHQQHLSIEFGCSFE